MCGLADCMGGEFERSKQILEKDVDYSKAENDVQNSVNATLLYHSASRNRCRAGIEYVY